MPPTLSNRSVFVREQRAAIRREFERAGIYEGLQVRSHCSARAAGRDEDSLRWVLTTEQPAVVFDWNRFDFVEEVLLMDGMETPAIKQVPFLDSHSRRSVDDVLGSVTDFQTLKTGGFAGVDGLVNFAMDEKSQRTKQKVIDGHLTDGSIGYGVMKSVWIPDEEEASVHGRIFTGPLKVSYRWLLKEFSGTPIGADTLAKVRSLCAGSTRSIG